MELNDVTLALIADHHGASYVVHAICEEQCARLKAIERAVQADPSFPWCRQELVAAEQILHDFCRSEGFKAQARASEKRRTDLCPRATNPE